MKYITKLFLMLLAVAVIAPSCKKKEDPEPDNTTTTTTTPPPAAPADSVKVGPTTYTNLSAKTCGIVSGKWQASCTYGTGYQLWIYTGATAVPSASTSFTLIPPVTPSVTPPLSAGQAYIWCSNSSIYESYSGGTLNVTVSGGVIKLGLNNVSLGIGPPPPSFTLPWSVQLTCP